MSGCYCDFDSPGFYLAQTRRARKPRKCAECGVWINPGELYEHVSGKWEDRIDTFNTCHRCVALRDFVQAHVPCFCWNHQSMLADAIETAREYASETVGLLFGALRMRVKIRRAVVAQRGEAR